MLLITRMELHCLSCIQSIFNKDCYFGLSASLHSSQYRAVRCHLLYCMWVALRICMLMVLYS